MFKWHTRRGSSYLNLIKEESDKAIAVEDGTFDQSLDLTEDTEDCIFVTPDEVAQVFSHFSFVHSGRKIGCICVYARQNDIFRFTDPVIHYDDVRKNEQRGLYGRTDVSDLQMFRFMSHMHLQNCIMRESLSFLQGQTDQKTPFFVNGHTHD